MQYDVKAVYTESSAALVPYRTRVKGAYIVVQTAGPTPVTLYDNASAATGSVLAQLGALSAGAHTVVIPGEGILAKNGIFCDIGDAVQVTVFYG
jgi:hypothetical protein